MRARRLLIADVAAYAQGRFDAVVVFDAAGNVSPERPNPTVAGVKVVFSKTGEQADSVIERLVTEAREHERPVTVITSDNTIRATVGGVPVTQVSSDVLISDVNQIVADTRRANEERTHQHMTLEERLTPEERAKLRKLIGR